MTVQIRLERQSLSCCEVLNAEQGSLVFLPQPQGKSLEILTQGMRLQDGCFGELTRMKGPESEGRGSDGWGHDSDRILGLHRWPRDLPTMNGESRYFGGRISLVMAHPAQ